MPARPASVERFHDAALRAAAEVPLRLLRPWPENPRTITAERLEQLKRNLLADREMLQARPLIALPDGTVICGNQRLLAAQELGWETIPTLMFALSWERARMWALRDNNPLGDWDEQALAELLAGLSADDVDLALTGFDDRTIDQLLATVAVEVDPDTAPALDDDADPVSKVGEVYQLGPHRLACGDARDRELLVRLLGEALVELIWTDPPYGVHYRGKTKRALTIANDGDEAQALLTETLQAVDGFLAESARFYIASPAGPLGTGFRSAVAEVGWKHRQTLVWVKNTLVLGRSDYHYQHEEILYGHRPGPGRAGRGRQPGSRWHGDNRQTSVFFVDRPAASAQHPTIKPVALIEPMLRNSSRRGEAVLDPFAGSGSTLIACERSGRRCYAVELDPRYCDVIRHRYSNYRDAL